MIYLKSTNDKIISTSCSKIRKLFAIEFFKIIFQECFFKFFRSICNFTYIAFALNRIGLSGKDHGKIVTFMNEVRVKSTLEYRYLNIELWKGNQ